MCVCCTAQTWLIGADKLDGWSVVFLWFFHRPDVVESRSQSVKAVNKINPATNTGPQSKVSTQRLSQNTDWFHFY